MKWRLGVVGSPIEHSLSPRLHEAGLTIAGLKGSSTRVELHEADAKKLAKWMGKNYDALSVTMPLKRAALSYCVELDDAASRIGAVNSLLWRDNRIEGANTDGAGFLASLRATFGVSVDNMHVVVLGSGGAARSVVDALVSDGVSSVAVHARSNDQVEDLSGRYANVYGHMLVYRPVDLIVNTIPESGRNNEGAVIQGVTPETIAVDITYAPSMSAWRAMYRAVGCRTQNGLGMLAYQAARQMSWWFETEIDGAELLQVIS
jgi:shikimate dehydrogenase